MTQPEDQQPAEPTSPEPAAPESSAGPDSGSDATAPYAADPYAADAQSPYQADPYAQNPYQPDAYGQPGYPGYEQQPAPDAQTYGYPGYPGQGYPTQGYPGQGYPTQGYPGQGYPVAGAPGYPNEPVRLTGGRLGMAVGQLVLSALVVLVGFLPWFTFDGESISGYAVTDNNQASEFAGAGVSTVFAMVALIVSIVSVCLRRRGMTIGQGVVCLVMGLFILAVAGVDISEGDLSGIDPGAGLLLATLLSLVMLILSIVQLAMLPRRQPAW